ncbi:MAG: hypothetical protein CL877_07525 [Dehalococcoidales bacterium]|jgi:quercetin dioxygenase-like cupin family protein|nr:hypothetical protein [Dehalococcoidales bacterium]|tara:strand:- start:715 stop:1074 length:360 start_codon:yes stop_codon:yes gene_type:complete
MTPIVWVKEYKANDLLPVPGIKGRFKRYVDGRETGAHLIHGLGMLAPGEDMGWHDHPEEEVFFVISGCGVVRWKVDNEICEAMIGPYSAFYKVGGVPHQMVNTGSEPLIGVVAKVSAHG